MKIDNIELIFGHYNSTELTLSTKPNLESLCTAFNGIPKSRLNEFYQQILILQGFSSCAVGFRFPDEEDYELVHLLPNKMECWCHYIENPDVLLQNTFFKIAVAYAESYILHYPEVANPEFLTLVGQLKLKIASHNFSEKLNSKLSTLRDLRTRRPLLVREKIELDFLQKIQAADSLELLQSIKNELNSTPTDPVLIQQLQRLINEKKAFY